MTRSLQGPGRDTDPDPLVQLAHRIRDIKRDVNDLTSNVLRMAGLRAEPDLLRVLGSLVVEGDLSVPSGELTLAGVPTDLAQAVADLATAQATLAAQQATLTTAVANIATLVSQQITGDSGHNSQTADLTTTESSYASFSIPVPAGYTRASVFGVASMYCSGGTYAYLRCRIAGQNGETQYALGVSGAVGNATAPHSRPLTGLSGGSITVEARANTATSTVTAVMVVAAQAIFLR